MTNFKRIRLAILLAVLSLIGVTAGVRLVFIGSKFFYSYILPWLYPATRAEGDYISAIVGGAIQSALDGLPQWFFIIMDCGIGLCFSFIGVMILLVAAVVRCHSFSRHAGVQLLATFVMGILSGLAFYTSVDSGQHGGQWTAQQFIVLCGITILGGLVAWNERGEHQPTRKLFVVSVCIVLLPYLPIAAYHGCNSVIQHAREARYTGRIQFDDPLTDLEQGTFFEQIRYDTNLQHLATGYARLGKSAEITFSPTTNVMADLVDVKGFEFTKIGPKTVRAKRLTNNVPDVKLPKTTDNMRQ